jgi:hypothetical protein
MTKPESIQELLKEGKRDLSIELGIDKQRFIMKNEYGGSVVKKLLRRNIRGKGRILVNLI